MQWKITILISLICLVASCGIFIKEKDRSDDEKHSSEIRLLDSWPEEGPGLSWKYQGLGKGYGGPLITQRGIFINAEENGHSYTLCLDHQGKLLWKSPNGKEFMGKDYSAAYPGTRSTPTAKGQHLYAASGMGHLSCFDASNGKVIWSVDLMETYKGVLGDFGYSESPAVDEDRIYCFPGGQTHNMVALDRYTGELFWTSPVNKDYFSYSTPLLLSLPERKVLVGNSRSYIHVVDRQDGKLLSSYQLEDISEGHEHCNNVVYKNGAVYFVPSEEHGQGSISLSLSADGSELSEVWQNRKVINVFEGFVVRDNYLYTTMENRKLLVLDTENGRIRHSVRAVSGSIVCADQKLIIYGHNGTVQLFSLKGDNPELKSEFRIRDGKGHHFSFPVIARGMMYIRHGDVLMAFSVS